MKLQFNTESHRASLLAYSLIDYGSREAIELLISYYKFDRQTAIDGWNSAFEDYKTYWAKMNNRGNAGIFRV